MKVCAREECADLTNAWHIIYDHESKLALCFVLCLYVAIEFIDAAKLRAGELPPCGRDARLPVRSAEGAARLGLSYDRCAEFRKSEFKSGHKV